MRLGGTTSVALGTGGGMLLTAFVQWGGAPSSTCDHSRPVRTCNQTSIVVFRSDDGVRFRYLSTLADAHDYPQSLEGPRVPRVSGWRLVAAEYAAAATVW